MSDLTEGNVPLEFRSRINAADLVVENASAAGERFELADALRKSEVGYQHGMTVLVDAHDVKG
jgi:hypothetical protein